MGHKTRKDRRREPMGKTRCYEHGWCQFCDGNKTYQDRRERKAADEQIDFYERSRTVNPLEQGHPGWY